LEAQLGDLLTMADHGRFLKSVLWMARGHSKKSLTIMSPGRCVQAELIIYIHLMPRDFVDLGRRGIAARIV